MVVVVITEVYVFHFYYWSDLVRLVSVITTVVWQLWVD